MANGQDKAGEAAQPPAPQKQAPKAQKPGRPAVFTKPAVLEAQSEDPTATSITGRQPKKLALSPLEKDVVGQMIARGEPVEPDVLENYNNTIEEEERNRKAEEARRLQRERKLQEEQERRKREAQEEARKAEAQAAAASAAQPPGQQQAPEEAEVPAPAVNEVLPGQVDDSQIPEIPPERLAKPVVVAVAQVPPSPIPPVETMPAAPAGMHAHRRALPEPAQPIPGKPRIVSVVDYGVITNGRGKTVANPAGQKLTDIARDLAPPTAGPGTPLMQGAQPSGPQSRQEAADLAVRIYEDKRRRQSILYRLGRLLGFNKEEPVQGNDEGFQ